MYNYEELKYTMVGIVDASINELILADEDDDPARIKRILDVMEKCQVCLQWIDMYSRATERLKEFLKPILDYYLQSLTKVLMNSHY